MSSQRTTSSRCVTSSESKMAILYMIREKKDILFGKFSSELEKTSKVAAWEEILLKAKSLQMVTADRTWKWVRDNLYGQWKTRALEKKDNAGKTGTAGGRKRTLDEVDQYILDIIGKDSPAISGVNGSESGRAAEIVQNISIQEFSQPVNDDDEEGEGCSVPPVSAPHPKIKINKKHLEAQEILAKKRKLQISVLELEAYKMQLETFKLEKELNIAHSDLTKDLVGKVIDYFSSQ